MDRWTVCVHVFTTGLATCVLTQMYISRIKKSQTPFDDTASQPLSLTLPSSSSAPTSELVREPGCQQNIQMTRAAALVWEPSPWPQ